MQEFNQKIEELSRGHDLELESLVHESHLKQEDAEVSQANILESTVSESCSC